MAVQTINQQASLTRWALRLDSAFEAALGLFLIVDAPLVADWFRTDSTGVIIALGFATLLFAADIAYMAVQPVINRQFVQMLMIVNFAWVIASVIALVTDMLNLTSAGNQAAIIIAIIVALLGELQFWGLPRG